MKINIALLAFAASLLDIAFGEIIVDRFIVNVNIHSSSSDIWGTLKCKATVITSRYVLTTATCATVSPPNRLSLQLNFPEWNSRTQRDGPVDEIIFHPDYVVGNTTFANIAVMRWAHVFDVTATRPRVLGSLPTNGSCNLFGFGSTAAMPTRHSIDVFSSESCDPLFPRVFCSVLPSMEHVSCGASEGSPVACTDYSVDGILLNQHNCTPVTDVGFRLNYHSIEEFAEWIEQVSAANPSSKKIVSLILSAVAISLAKFIVIS